VPTEGSATPAIAIGHTSASSAMIERRSCLSFETWPKRTSVAQLKARLSSRPSWRLTKAKSAPIGNTHRAGASAGLARSIGSLGRTAIVRPRVLTVLVADDSTHMRELVRITLSSQGWRVVETGDPDTVSELVTAAKPDLVLLDVTFEGFKHDGFDVCRTLKGDAATRDVPVVMLSAHDKAADRAEGRAVGASDYLLKPFGPIELIDAIKKVLDLR
jgi:CheY-like chemotaxis protein